MEDSAMSPEEHVVLVRRLEKLEKGNGRLKLALAVTLLVGLGWFLLSQTPRGEAQQGAPNVIQAQAFQMVDANGKVLMNLSHVNGVTKMELTDGTANGPIAGVSVGKTAATYHAKGSGKSQGELVLAADHNSSELQLKDVKGKKNVVNP